MYRITVIAFFAIFLGTANLFGWGTREADSQTIPSISPPIRSTGRIADLRSLGFTVFSEPQAIPAVRTATPDGGILDLRDFRGKYVFLNFWATWCPPCRAEMPSMERLHGALADEPFAIVAISVGEKPDTVVEFLQLNPYTFPIGLDPENRLGSVFAGRGIPTTYIVDPQGRAVAGKIGGREWDSPSTIELFRSLVRGK